MNTSKKGITPALAEYEPFYERILKTGSRVICEPIPSESSDEDYLVLCTQDQRQQLETRLQADGWTLGGSLPNGNQVSQGVIDTLHGPIEVTSSDFQPDFTLNTQHEYKNGMMDHSRVFHSWKRYETPTVYAPIEGSWMNEVVSEAKGPEINLLVTCNETYFDDFTRATFLCQGLNLLEKEDRVMVFEALTREVWPSGRKKKKNKMLFKKLFGGTPEEFYGASPLMEILQLQQAQNAVNPPVVLPGVPPGTGVGLDANGEWTTLHNVLNPPATGQTVTLMNGQVIPG